MCVVTGGSPYQHTEAVRHALGQLALAAVPMGVICRQPCCHCGQNSHESKFCPRAACCKFCDKTHHLTQNCWRAIPCTYCREKTHLARDCPSKQQRPQAVQFVQSPMYGFPCAPAVVFSSGGPAVVFSSGGHVAVPMASQCICLCGYGGRSETRIINGTPTCMTCYGKVL